MSATTGKADDDDLAAFDALESEAKEFTKVNSTHATVNLANTLTQDAEIDRILKAFRLDA